MIPRDFHRHPRDWRGFLYVYPVISRRSRGLSIGVNLNPDAACNFDCIYCQVDRSATPRVRNVDLDILRAELAGLLDAAIEGSLFEEPEFSATPMDLRRINDIAFSGDGEPTTCPVFAEAVGVAAVVKRERQADQVQLILITDACYLTVPRVAAGLEIMDGANGRVWAKLDAGTEAYYGLVNRPNFTLDHVLENILHAARVRPVTIQSLFMRIDGQPPSREEIDAYVGRLCDLRDAGARLEDVQVYTVARPPAEANVSPLTDAEVDAIVAAVRERGGLAAEAFYG